MKLFDDFLLLYFRIWVGQVCVDQVLDVALDSVAPALALLHFLLQLLQVLTLLLLL